MNVIHYAIYFYLNERSIMTTLSLTFVSRITYVCTYMCVTFDKINPPGTNDRHYNRSKYQRSSAVIVSERSARPCFEADQTSSRQIRDIFKGFRPTLCRRIRDNREIWHEQTYQRYIPVLAVTNYIT